MSPLPGGGGGREGLGSARGGAFRLCAWQSSVIGLSPQSILATALIQSSRVAMSEQGPGSLMWVARAGPGTFSWSLPRVWQRDLLNMAF